MENLLQYFTQEFPGVKAIVIGGTVRKILGERANLFLPDRIKEDHFDLLLEFSQSRGARKKCQTVLDHLRAVRKTKMCFEFFFSGRRVELVGFIVGRHLLTVDWQPFPSRTHLSIERIGLAISDQYDESGRGFQDFSDHCLHLSGGTLYTVKYLKILSVKFQTRFQFDRKSLAGIEYFENNIPLPDRTIIDQGFGYNKSLYSGYDMYDPKDPAPIGIHAALMYLRCHNPQEVTDYIESRSRLKTLFARVGIDYQRFHQQIVNNEI